MYFNDSNLQYIMNNIREITPHTVLLSDPSWKNLASTNPDVTTYFQEILEYCRIAENYKMAEKHFGISISSCFLNQELICYVIILDQSASCLQAYIQTMLQLILTPQFNDIHSQTANTRSMLVNQLSNTRQNNSEIDSFMKEFDYSYSSPRCAVLIEIMHHNTSTFSYKFDSTETALEEEILTNPFFSKEDIFGFISTERYLIYKDTQVFPNTALHSNIKDYIAQLADALQHKKGVALHITIGSAYSDLFDLRNSYLESLFLMTNYDYLNSDQKACLFIDDYLFEYFSSLIPQDYWNNRFSQLFQIAESNPVILETATAMSRYDQNLSMAATSLNLHRNTMLQRFSKLKSLTSLNPLQSDYDRMLLRAFTLHANQKITLQAGIVIQPNSVLHQGMQKMADLVFKNSNGKINIHLHTLSLSGNNQQLFDILRSGSIDFVVVATGVMNKFTNNRSKLLEYPFLFRSNQEASYLLNSTILEDFEPFLDAISVKCLNIWTMGWRYLTSNTPIQTPQDMIGKKVRVMFTESLDEYYRNMGAIPVKMNYHDVKDALHAGIIDCQENPYSNTLGMKFYEEQSYITRLKYYLSTEALYTSKASWESLTPLQREIIASAAKRTTNWIFKEQQEVINQKCKNVLINEKGMKLVEITPDEVLQWKGYAEKMYDAFPHQDLLQKIERARKDYYDKYGHTQTQ